MTDVAGVSSQVDPIPGGGVRGAQLGVPGLVKDSGVAVADALDQQKGEFTEADRTNGRLRTFVQQSSAGTIVKRGEHEYEVIQSGSDKLLMLSEIITKDRDGMRDISQGEWIDTIIRTQGASGLKVMSQDQMGPIQNDERIFPHGMIYLSSSPGYGSYFWAWSPASSSWGYCYAGSTPGCGSSGYYYNNYYYPVALRCVVELS